MPNAHFDYVLGRRQTNVSFEINTGGTPPLCRGARATMFQEVGPTKKEKTLLAGVFSFLTVLCGFAFDSNRFEPAAT